MLCDDDDDSSYLRRVAPDSKVNFSKLCEEEKVFRMKNMAK